MTELLSVITALLAMMAKNQETVSSLIMILILIIFGFLIKNLAKSINVLKKDIIPSLVRQSTVDKIEKKMQDQINSVNEQLKELEDKIDHMNDNLNHLKGLCDGRHSRGIHPHPGA